MNRTDLINELWDIANSRENIKAKIQFYQQLIEEIGMRSSDINCGIRGNKISNPVLDKIVSEERYHEEIQQAMDTLNANIKRFDSLLSCLTQTEQAILRCRYLMGVRWDFINHYPPYYSRRQAIRLHNKAIDKILKHNS